MLPAIRHRHYALKPAHAPALVKIYGDGIFSHGGKNPSKSIARNVLSNILADELSVPPSKLAHGHLLAASLALREKTKDIMFPASLELKRILHSSAAPVVAAYSSKYPGDGRFIYRFTETEAFSLPCLGNDASMNVLLAIQSDPLLIHNSGRKVVAREMAQAAVCYFEEMVAAKSGHYEDWLAAWYSLLRPEEIEAKREIRETYVHYLAEGFLQQAAVSALFNEKEWARSVARNSLALVKKMSQRLLSHLAQSAEDVVRSVASRLSG